MKIIWMIAAGCGYSLAFAADSGSVNEFGSLILQHQSSFSRLLISLDDSFKPVIRDRSGGFEIRIPSATLMDIGVPFGGEAEFNRHLRSVGDSRIAKVTVKETGEDLLVSGQYLFPKGKAALADPRMEHFDFHQNEKGKYVVDFWYKKGPTLIEAEQARKVREAKELSQKKQEILKKDQEIRAQREKRMEESRKALQFCDSPLDPENNLWIKFRIEHPVLNLNAYHREDAPDFGYRFVEPNGKSEEEKMVRLALKLSKDEKEALVIKTVDFLEKSYPRSRFLKEMKFLKAGSLYRLGMKEPGQVLVLDISKSFQGTDVGLQATAFLGLQSFRKGEWLAALDHLSKIHDEDPDHALNWLFHYATGESLYHIRQYDQAAKEYEWLKKNAPKKEIRAEMAFKTGDLFFNRNQLGQAVQYYTDAIRKHPEELEKFPQIYLNLAETYFQLEEYERAGERYLKFLEVARANPAAWKASLRLAEIRSIQNPKDFEKNLIETVNQYPMTAGSVIARLRMIPCGNHGGFDLSGAARFLGSDEVKKMENESFYSSSLQELVWLTEVRTLLSFGEDEEAIRKGISILRENPTIEARRLVELGIIGGVKRLLEKQLDSKNFYGAIATYEKFGTYLPPPTYDPIGDQIRLKIAKFAAEKKLNQLAIKLLDPYRSGDEAELKLAANDIQKTLFLESKNDGEERIFLEAKAIWNGEKINLKDEKEAAQFLEKLDVVREGSPLSLERDLLKALFYRETGVLNKAMELTSTFQSRLEKLSPRSKAQILSFLGELSKASNDAEAASRAFREARMIAMKLTEKDGPGLEYRQLPNVPSVSYLVIAEGEQLEGQQKWKEAVALYTEAIENKIGGNHILYAHARALMKDGGRNSILTASRSLEKIQQSQDDDVWKKLARSALDEIAKEGKNDEKRK